jgi:hypothetical protein
MLALPLLLATTIGRSRRVVVVVALGCLAWQLDPLVSDLRSPPSAPFTALNRHLEAVGSQRVEVLAGRDHREASEVITTTALARGWARQVDVRDNPLFYRPEPLQETEYVTWLKQNAIDRVAVPREGAFDYGSVLAADLLRLRIRGLSEEWRDRDWIVYRVEDPTPVVAEPGKLLAYERTHLLIASPVQGEIAVDIRWSRWLSATGPACIEQAGDRVVLRFDRPGTATLTSSLQPDGRC